MTNLEVEANPVLRSSTVITDEQARTVAQRVRGALGDDCQDVLDALGVSHSDSIRPEKRV